jgi:hypothetical protein
MHKHSMTAPTLQKTGEQAVLDSKHTSYKSIAHWQTNLAAANIAILDNPINKSERPQWTFPRQAYTSNRSNFRTEYMNNLGTYGDNPIKKLNADSEKLDIIENDLTYVTFNLLRIIHKF